MSIEIKVPALPESVADAVVLNWHKQPGEPVKRDENLVDLETDKIVLEVPAPADGVIDSITATPGTTVEDGSLLALFVAQAVDADSGSGAAAGVSAGDSGGDAGDRSGGAPAASTKGADPDAQAGPAARKLMNEVGLSAAEIVGTGKDGRILKSDVEAAIKSGGQTSGVASDMSNNATSSTPSVASVGAPASAQTPAPTPASSVPPAASAPRLPSSGERSESREPMSRIRQTIANRLVNAQQTTAMLTTFNEVDMSAVMALRSKYKDAFEKQHGIKLGFMSFFVRASVEALRKFPLINAYIDGTDIVHSSYNDIGIAVSSPRGLVVPIIRDAELLSFADIELAISDFGARAQSGGLGLNDLTGGTFTITNGGIFGSLVSTPILNPPQSAILGMHAIQQRPVAIDGEVEVRPMMYLALSYDHRIVDGKDAVQFLVAIKNALEDPARMLLNIG